MQGNKREQQREETRRKLFAASLDVFRRDGVEAARIDEIAARVGVSRGTFYFHFPTKEDVLALAYAEANARLVALIEGASADTEIRALLGQIVSDIAKVWEGDPRLFSQVGLHALRQVAHTDPSAPRDPVRQHLALRFGDAISRGELVEGLPPDLLADIFLLNAFTGMLAWSANPGLPLEPVLHGVVHLFLVGAARPTTVL
jgi:AcrR family transcriptional regulator